MKIRSSELRSLVRASVLNELSQGSDFGRVGNLDMDFRCEWIDRVPQNLTKLFNTIGGNVEEILGDTFPAIKLGPKASKDASLVTTLLGELGYVMTEFWAAQGGPCVGFYFFNQALVLVASILDLFDLNTESAQVKSSIDTAVPQINFMKGIQDRAGDLAGSRDRSAIKDNFPFYVFPNLTGGRGIFAESIYSMLYEESEVEMFNPTDSNLKKLQKDLSAYRALVASIRNIKTKRVDYAVKDIVRALGIESYVDFRASSSDTSQETVDQLKGAAQVALTNAFREASKSFDHVPEYNTMMVGFTKEVLL